MRVQWAEIRSEGRCIVKQIIKNVQKYISSAKTERQILKNINERDPDDQYGIVRYKESFFHRGSYCLVFKPLGKSLYEFIKMNSYKGFPISMVQAFFKQILHSIGFLHRIGYTHTDLKPENILLESEKFYKTKYEDFPYPDRYYLPNSTKIRIIDFGGATKYD